MPSPASAPRYRIGVDTGGTFTDLVLIDEASGTRRTIKVPSTPAQPSAAVFHAVDQAGVEAAEIGFFVLGTTIATNALIERKGQTTLFLTTEGFEDVPFIQRINRKSLFDLQWVKPPPYVKRSHCIGVRERIAADGTARIELTSDEIERLISRLEAEAARRDGGIAVAVSLLFAYLNPSHEQALAEAIRAALPDVPLSVSSEVAPIWREYERANTVIVDAYLRRLLGRFAADLGRGLEQRDISSGCFLLKSNGGQAPAHAAARQPCNLVLSGLAGGMIAARYFAEGAGAADVLTLDMGGTSADVGVVHRSRIRSAAQYEFEFGLPIAVPVIDLSTIGAGGSSIAEIDPGGLLKVGPESAGADPGPAAYGRGGERPTVTDANLVLGRLNPDYFLGGALPLDVERAQAAVESIARRLGLSIEDAARSILDVAVENMAGAIRLLAADRGLDYRRFALMAFGGAGPLHAAQLARRVGLAGVLVPPNPGLASAFGTLVADLRVDRRMTRLLRSDTATSAELRDGLAAIARDAADELRREGGVRDPTLLLTVSCRYLGQNFEHDVAIDPGVDARDLVERVVERFHAEHERVYGYRMEGTVVEFVHLSATAIEYRSPPVLAEPAVDGAQASTERMVYFADTGWMPTPIHRRAALPLERAVDGPAVIEEPDATTLVLAGQRARVTRGGMLAIDDSEVTRGR